MSTSISLQYTFSLGAWMRHLPHLGVSIVYGWNRGALMFSYGCSVIFLTVLKLREMCGNDVKYTRKC
jgi:hypothetical protein